jgi:hypothetical protein
MPLLAIEASIPASLWVHFAALLLLLASLHGLCGELRVRTPSPLVAVLVLSSPVLIGLARTLYVEFTLAALATAAFWLWLRVLAKPTPGRTLGFGLLFGLGFMTKTTFPVFMAAPLVGALLGRLVERRGNEAAILAIAVVLPAAVAVLVHLNVFSQSLGYYGNLESISLPFMYLMGPPETWSWASLTYYFGEVGRSYLYWLTPMLLIAALVSARRLAGFRWRDLASPRAALWLWFLGPLVLLIAHPLKEPRHAAFCVVPAVLLLVLGIEELRRPVLRTALLAVSLLLAVAQYAAVTLGSLPTPYFLDRSLHAAAIRQAMLDADDRQVARRTTLGLRDLHENYARNVALVDFPPNQALALTWQGFPCVVFDMKTFDDPSRSSDEIPYSRFEDLYFLAGINSYNRRCGWHEYYETLSRERVLANADFVIVDGASEAELAPRFPGHVLVATILREGEPLRVLRARAATRSYRALYAREFLARNPTLGREEVRVVAQDLLVGAALRGDRPAARAVLCEFPSLRRAASPPRNIYWIAGYPQLLGLAEERMAVWDRSDR